MLTIIKLVVENQIFVDKKLTPPGSSRQKGGRRQVTIRQL